MLQNEVYFIRRNLIVCILDILSMKCKNIQLEISSGNRKHWCGAQKRNEDHDHLNQGGSWLSG